MFENLKVTHTKYGEGTITDFTLNTEEELKSKISVDFDSGESKLFPLQAFTGKKFLTTTDDTLNKFIEDLVKKEEDKKLAKQQPVEEPKHYKITERYSLANWKRAQKVAEEHRFKYESRAVIMDDDIIFISASDALKYLEADARKGDVLYATCELSKKNKVYLGHTWRYATKEEIGKLIEEFKDDDIGRTEKAL